MPAVRRRTMPSSRSRRTFPSCAGRRTPRSSSPRPRRWDCRRSRSRTATRLPAWCARTWPRRRRGFGSSSARVSISKMHRACSAFLRTAPHTAVFAACSRSARAARRKASATCRSPTLPPMPKARSSSRSRPATWDWRELRAGAVLAGAGRRANHPFQGADPTSRPPQDATGFADRNSLAVERCTRARAALSRRIPRLSRRRPRAHRRAGEAGRTLRYAARRHQRRALSRAPPPRRCRTC